MSDELDNTIEVSTLDLPTAPTVLIIDDDALVLAHLARVVKAAGYDVLTATDGAQALLRLERSHASIVITDLNMPGVNGLEICRRIRAQSWPRYVYLILLTICDDEPSILAGLEAGADDYLSKRTSAAQLTARLRTAKRILGLEYSLKAALEQKRRMAMTDSLTGAYNRRYFMRHLSRELKRMHRSGGELSLILLDIDHFKRVNDTFGHATGDLVLKKLTSFMSQTFQRETDWCARLGGEEFVVVLEGTSMAHARIGAEKLRQFIANTPIDSSSGQVSVTVSMGISGVSAFDGTKSASVESLLEDADANLYASKSAGRNRVTWRTGKPRAVQLA